MLTATPFGAVVQSNRRHLADGVQRQRGSQYGYQEYGFLGEEQGGTSKATDAAAAAAAATDFGDASPDFWTGNDGDIGDGNGRRYQQRLLSSFVDRKHGIVDVDQQFQRRQLFAIFELG